MLVPSLARAGSVTPGVETASVDEPSVDEQ